MKKPTRSFGVDDQGVDSSQPLDLGRMDDDDEIIDLEDVIELPDFDDHSEEGRFGGEDDVEMFDAESGLVVKGIDLKADDKEVDLLSEDFLKSFDTPKGKDSSRESGVDDDPFRNELEDDILKELSLFDKPSSESGSTSPELRDEGADSDALLPGRDSAGSKVEDTSFDLDLDALIEREKASALEAGDEKELADILALEKTLRDDAIETAPSQAATMPAAGVVPPAQAAVALPESRSSDAPAKTGAPQADSALDAVVEGIELRLLQAVRGMVEARLPELVRSILREEIDRLREELKD